MYTECPTCNTVFRVYPEQLDAAGGRVRCGECLAVFDARDYRRDDLEEPPPSAEIESEAIPAGQGREERAEPDLFAEELSAALAATAPEHEPVPPPSPKPAVTPSPRPAARVAPAPAQPPRAPKPSPKRRPDPGLELPFGEEFAASTSAPRGRWLATGMLLLVFLAGQYLWFNRQTLSQVPALAPAMHAFCGLLPCGLESLPDPGAFELTGRAVQSHPSFEGALLVDVTFVNQSNMARPYPGLELVFTDMEGNLLASRRFTPVEYLGSAPQQPLAPGGEAHALLELLDPGDLAAGYEFRFF